MFRRCESLEKLNLLSFHTILELTNYVGMFYGIPDSCELKCKDLQIMEKFNLATGRGCCNCFLY